MAAKLARSGPLTAQVTEPASGQTENEVSNLRPFRLKVAVRTSEGHPPPMVRLMLRVSLVVESPDAGVQAVQPFLSQEDARSPLLVRLAGSPLDHLRPSC